MISEGSCDTKDTKRENSFLKYRIIIFNCIFLIK